MAILSLTNPVVGGSEDTWGTTLNTNLTNIGTFIGTLDSTELAVLDGITATTAELNILDGVTATAAELNILDGVTATAAEINVLDGITATVAELNYTDGVTSNIQTQLNAKAPLASPALTGTPTAPTAAASTDTTQIATTAFAQDAIDAKALGVGQTWQDVSGSRAQNTSYQNTTGKPIVVHIWGGGSATTGLQVSTDNSTWVNVGRGEANYDSITVIVPDQHYYRMTAGYTSSSWVELR